MGREREEAPDEMIEHLRRRGIVDEEVLDVMRRIPRHHFIEKGLEAMAYDDRPLPSGHGPPVPQPFLAAQMTEAAVQGRRHRALQVGTDSGYLAALLSLLFDEVYTVERHKDIAARAMRLLQRLGLPVKLREADGGLGWPDHAPYDAIVVLAGATRPPDALMDQLAEGGTLVIPIGGAPMAQRLMAFTKTPAGVESRDYGPVAFVPLIGTGGWGREYAVQPVIKTGAAMVERLRSAAQTFDITRVEDLRPSLDHMQDARFILLGASTHGTKEFQELRARLTLKFVQEFDCRTVAFAADWATGQAIDAYVQHQRSDPPPTGHRHSAAFQDVQTLRLLDALREINGTLEPERRVHVRGLDLFCADHAVARLADADRKAEADAPVPDDTHSDPVAAIAAMVRVPSEADDAASTPVDREPAADRAQVAAELQRLLQERLQAAGTSTDQRPPMEEADLQEAIERGGRFYDGLARRDPAAWLLRDQQMAHTLAHLAHADQEPSRVVVWAHNVLVGDARAVGPTGHDVRNLGRLLKEHHAPEVHVVGFGTYAGKVRASGSDGSSAPVRQLPPPVKGSQERLWHATGIPACHVSLLDPRLGFLASARAQRAIGAFEARDGSLIEHYIQARLAPQFDTYVWIDETTAATPLPDSHPIGVSEPSRPASEA